MAHLATLAQVKAVGILQMHYSISQTLKLFDVRTAQCTSTTLLLCEHYHTLVYSMAQLNVKSLHACMTINDGYREHFPSEMLPSNQ